MTQKTQSSYTADDRVSKEQGVIKKLFTARNIARMGILTAISYVLYMFVKFPLPALFPSFLDMQFSDIPALIGGFAMGPLAGTVITILKCCMKMPFTSSACVGELADAIIGLAFVLPASIVYNRHKNRRSAVLGIILGSITATGFSILANWLVIIPFYVRALFEGNWQILIDMLKPLYSAVTKDTFYTYYLLLSVLPFNALRLIANSIIVVLIYKPLSPLLHDR